MAAGRDHFGMGEGAGPIILTGEEREAVLELALRPTFAIEPGADASADPDTEMRNAALLALADRVTAAATAGRLPPELHQDVRRLLREAIHDTRHELWREELERDRWRAGDAGYALAGVPEEEHERRFAEQIDRCARLLDALTSLALKLTP